MQITTSGFVNELISGSLNPLNGTVISWPATLGSGNFFTINVSAIGGTDFIPGSQSFPTFLDRYAYTDYSDHMISWNVTRSFGQYPYGAIAADATLVLDNTDNLFTPGYDGTIGSYILLPNRPVKISCGVFNGTSNEYIMQFAGYTSPPELNEAERSISLRCFDGMAYLNSFPSKTTTIQVNKYFDQILATLLQEAGFASTQYVLEQSLQQPIGYFDPYNQNIGDIIQKGCEAEQAIAFFDENGTFHFWNRQHLVNNSTSLWTFTNDNTEGFSTVNTPVINDVIFKANPRAVQAQQNVWQLASAVSVPASGAILVSADFSDDDGSLPVTSVQAPVYSTSGNITLNTSTYLTNINSDGSGLSYDTYITTSGALLHGTNYQIYFLNSFTSPVYITSMYLAGTPAKVTDHINEEYSDSTSITKYGLNPANNGQPLEIQNDLIQDPSTAHSNAYQLVTDYASANVRVQATVFAAPQLQLGDCVTRTNFDTGVTTTYTVVGITTESSPTDAIKQDLILEVKQLVKYFQINVSTINSSDQIAP